MHIKRHINEKKSWLPIIIIIIIIAIGLLFAAVISFYKKDVELAENNLKKTANYMKVQCSTYTHYNDGSETQALLRAAESNSQVREWLYENKKTGEELSEAFLSKCADTAWLHGIIIIDAEGNVKNSYAKNKQEETKLLERVEKKNLLDGLNYPERIYTQRIYFDDGGYANMASASRADADEIVVTYYVITAECARAYSLTLQSLLEGYSIATDGTIIVADEGRIIACNDESLLNQSTNDNAIIQTLKANADSKHIMHIPSSRCYGLMLKQRDYYIYTYLPDKTIFSTLPQNVFIVMMLYCCVVSVIWVMMRASTKAHQRVEAEKEKHYREMLLESAKKADAANVAKTEFLQRMSHDIRTPINGICGMLEVAEYYKNDLDKQAECRAKIKDASHLLLELVNEVLDMGKLESGEVVLEEQPFDLHEVVDEVLAVIERMASEQGLKLTIEEFDITNWQLIGSARHVKRLLMNIMSNAVKYNKEFGSIEFSCRELPSDRAGETLIEFVCRDTGIGMSPEYQQRIFEPFTQENKEVQSKYGGSGLGMPIAKGLVDKMEGSLTFESEPGVGTTFVIRIPFRINEAVRENSERHDSQKHYSIANYHILVAEDNELNMEIAEFILETEGAVVEKAWNGQEAAEIFEKSRPGEFDAILMDVMMPTMGGYQASRHIRSMDRADAKTVPIIAMTANAFTEDRIQSREAGMNAHISKPLNSALMVKTIYRQVLAARAKEQA